MTRVQSALEGHTAWKEKRLNNVSTKLTTTQLFLSAVRSAAAAGALCKLACYASACAGCAMWHAASGRAGGSVRHVRQWPMRTQRSQQAHVFSPSASIALVSSTIRSLLHTSCIIPHHSQLLEAAPAKTRSLRAPCTLFMSVHVCMSALHVACHMAASAAARNGHCAGTARFSLCGARYSALACDVAPLVLSAASACCRLPPPLYIYTHQNYITLFTHVEQHKPKKKGAKYALVQQRSLAKSKRVKKRRRYRA